jgi:hypothetical protein
MSRALKYFRILQFGDGWDYWFLEQPTDQYGRMCRAGEFQCGRIWNSENKLSTRVKYDARHGNFVRGGLGEYYVSRTLMDKLRIVVPPELIQGIPVTIEGVDEQYEILNTLDVVDCVDNDRSWFDLVPEDFPNSSVRGCYRMHRFVADARKCAGHDLFRVKRWEIALLCSDRIRNLLLANKVTGIRFDPVELSHNDDAALF